MRASLFDYDIHVLYICPSFFLRGAASEAEPKLIITSVGEARLFSFTHPHSSFFFLSFFRTNRTGPNYNGLRGSEWSRESGQHRSSGHSSRCKSPHSGQQERQRASKKEEESKSTSNKRHLNFTEPIYAPNKSAHALPLKRDAPLTFSCKTFYGVGGGEKIVF